MKKIKTLFRRDFSQRGNPIIPEYAVELPPNCRATIKYDGTAIMIKDGKVFGRYDAKNGKQPPEGWIACEKAPDPVDGHWPGWLPANPSGKASSPLRLALAGKTFEDGTYELCGPKVNGNPEKLTEHKLIEHGIATLVGTPIGFEELKTFLSELDIEGIVWWRDNEPLAKIKKRDFGLKR